MLPDAVHAVIADVAHCDKDAGEVERDFFLTGMSLGGLTVLLASLPHARDAAPRFYARLLGTYALCPVIGSKYTTEPINRRLTRFAVVDPPPPTAVIVIVQALSKYVGKKAVFSPTKNGVDNVSDSPEMWQAMINDREYVSAYLRNVSLITPLTAMVYSGNMRLASAMAFVGGMSTMNSNASNLRSRKSRFLFRLIVLSRIAGLSVKRCESYMASEIGIPRTSPARASSSGVAARIAVTGPSRWNTPWSG